MNFLLSKLRITVSNHRTPYQQCLLCRNATGTHLAFPCTSALSNTIYLPAHLCDGGNLSGQLQQVNDTLLGCQAPLLATFLTTLHISHNFLMCQWDVTPETGLQTCRPKKNFFTFDIRLAVCHTVQSECSVTWGCVRSSADTLWNTALFVSKQKGSSIQKLSNIHLHLLQTREKTTTPLQHPATPPSNAAKTVSHVIFFFW